MSVKDAEATTKFEKITANSEDVLLNLTSECMDMITCVQVANDTREINRRSEESQILKRRRKYADEEFKTAQEKIDVINSKWGSISELKDSVDIYNAYEDQKNKYFQIIYQKDEIIKELQSGLEVADKKYIRDQKLQWNDINILAKRIDEHVEIIRRAYRKHLQLINDTATEERKSLLHKKHIEWENVNSIFEQEHVEDMNKIFKSVEMYERETVNMIWDHHEKYHSMKMRLETQLQTLQIKLKETKTYCMLEERKLEYNHLVLSERREELGKIKARQRSRINKLHEELTNLRDKQREVEKINNKNSFRLKIEIFKLATDRNALVQKMKRTDDMNENTFDQIWTLNEKRVRKIIDKIMKIDQVINGQILRSEYIAPTLEFKSISELHFIQSYAEHVINFQNAVNFNASLPTAITHNYLKSSLNVGILKCILRNIAHSMKYIMKDELVHLSTKNVNEETKTLVQFDSILKILDICSEDELESLQEYFLPYIKCSTCLENKSKVKFHNIGLRGRSHRVGIGTHINTGIPTAIAKSPLCTTTTTTTSILNRRDGIKNAQKLCQDVEHEWTINQCMVFKILANFIHDKEKRSQENHAKLRKIPFARVLTPNDFELYWKSFKFPYLVEFQNFCDVVNEPLKEYLQLIKEKRLIQSEIDILIKQNSELRRVLSYFIEESKF